MPIIAGMNPVLLRELLIRNAFPAWFFLVLAASKIPYKTGAGLLSDMSRWFLVFQLTLAGVFFIFRYNSKETSRDGKEIIMALLGTFLPSCFQTLKSLSVPEWIQIPALVLQGLGNILAAFATLSLGRAIGMIPAHRGIKTQGMYRWVRHPLYASYQIANLGFLIQHPSWFNVLVFGAALVAQILRIQAEEKLLQHDPDYRKYQNQVRWRLLPFVY